MSHKINPGRMSHKIPHHGIVAPGRIGHHGTLNTITAQQKCLNARNQILANSHNTKAQQVYNQNKQVVTPAPVPTLYHPPIIQRVVVVQPVPVPQSSSVTPAQLKQATDNTNEEIQKLTEKVNDLTLQLKNETTEKQELKVLLEKDRENLARIHGMLEEICSPDPQSIQPQNLQINK
jgi:hypothetical protein